MIKEGLLALGLALTPISIENDKAICLVNNELVAISLNLSQQPQMANLDAARTRLAFPLSKLFKEGGDPPQTETECNIGCVSYVIPKNVLNVIDDPSYCEGHIYPFLNGKCEWVLPQGYCETERDCWFIPTVSIWVQPLQKVYQKTNGGPWAEVFYNTYTYMVNVEITLQQVDTCGQENIEYLEVRDGNILMSAYLIKAGCTRCY